MLATLQLTIRMKKAGKAEQEASGPLRNCQAGSSVEGILRRMVNELNRWAGDAVRERRTVPWLFIRFWLYVQPGPPEALGFSPACYERT